MLANLFVPAFYTGGKFKFKQTKFLIVGAGMRYKDRYDPDILEIAPFFLLPSPFPKRDFENIIEIQPVINLLMHKVAHDYNFLHSCLKKLVILLVLLLYLRHIN